MKTRILVYVLFVAAVFSFSSCDSLRWLSNYEEMLSLTDEEYDELIVGKWNLTDVGNALELDDVYHEERVVNQSDRPIITSIKSIEFKTSSAPTIYFKEDALFYVYDWYNPSGTVEYIESYKEFAVDYTKQLVKFGLDSDGNEFFILYKGMAGGINNYQIRLYGVEKGDNYDVKRIILHAEDDSYYEFKPAK